MIRTSSFSYNFLLTCVVIAFFSCDPIYIPDPIDPRLPKYTEAGNNVGGAFINDVLWKSEMFIDLFGSTDAPTIHYNKNSDSLVIIFTGKKAGESKDTQIVFGLSDTGVTNLAEMIKLNGKKFALDGIRHAAFLSEPSSPCEIPGIGQLYCRSVKYNRQNNLITLSGTFGFTSNDPVCGNNHVTYGRFDFRFNSFQLL